MKKKEKNKEIYVDDGHTVYDMKVDAAWSKQDEEENEHDVSKKERRILIRAAFRAYIPKLLLVLACFGIAIIIIYFWLN